MPRLILFNKPYGVICQFSQHELHPTLKDHLAIPGVYPAGRLDTDSEGLLLLTGDGELQHRISDPRWKQPKTYWVQVEGSASEAQLQALRDALSKGEKRVTFGDKTVEYRTVEELKQAIAEVEAAMHKDAVATGLYPRAPRQIRVTTGKGF